MSRAFVLDSSALLCLVNEEPGSERVFDVLNDSVMNSVNLAEVTSKLIGFGMSRREMADYLGASPIEFVGFDAEIGIRAGELREATNSSGLSLGDRACLATAESRNAIALTADRAWGRIASAIEIKIELIR